MTAIFRPSKWRRPICRASGFLWWRPAADPNRWHRPSCYPGGFILSSCFLLTATTSLFPPDPLQESGPHSRRHSSCLHVHSRLLSARPCRGVALPEPPPASTPTCVCLCVTMTNTFVFRGLSSVCIIAPRVLSRALPPSIRPAVRLCECDFSCRRASVLSTPRPLRAAAALIVLYSFGIL